MREVVAQELRQRIGARGGFVNAHAHLDIAYVSNLALLDDIACDYGLSSREAIGQLPLKTKIELLDVRLRSDHAYIDSLTQRMEYALKDFERQGVCAVRSCLTFGTEIGTHALDVATRLRDAWGARVKLQTTALHLRPLLDDAAEQACFERACADPRIDVVGGLPQVHPDRVEEYFDWLFALAARVDKPLETHTDEFLHDTEDETAQLASAAKTWRKRGFNNRVSVVHAMALSAQPPAKRKRVAEELAAEDVAVVICPRSALSIKTLEISSYMHNAIAPLSDLLDAGVCVALGTDNIGDVFLPFSGGDLLEEIEFLAETTRLYDLDVLADIASTNGARALGL